jgi:cation diffusion facilitator family transporter
MHPQKIGYLWAVIAASIIGFIGNEAVAIFRIRVGREIGSAALVADGYHARVDGLTSLAVLFGAIGVWLGYPLADPIVGLFITVTISRIVWDSGKAVFSRILDSIDPEVVEEIRHAVSHIKEVREITEVRVRWVGHRLHTELNIALDSSLTIEKAHTISKEVRHILLHHLKYLDNAIIHVDPMSASGEQNHNIAEHSHDGSIHSHN